MGSLRIDQGGEAGIKALLEGIRALNEPLDPETVLKVLVEQSRRLFGADRCGVYLFDEEGLLSCAASHGLSREYLEAVRGHSPWSADVEEKPEPLFVPDASAEPELSELRGIIEREGVRSILFLPLFHGRLLGKLALYHDRPYSWEPEEIELAQALADQAALAVAHAQEHIRERRRGELLAQLQEISAKWLHLQLDLQELLEEVVQAGAKLLGTKGGALYLYDERADELELVICYNQGADKCGLRLKPGEGLSGRVLVSGKPMVVEDYSCWPHRSPQWADVPVTSVAAVPLLYRGRVIGVLNATHLYEPRKFTDEDLRILQLFANQAAAVIEQARLRDLQTKYLEVGAQLLTATELSPILQGVVEALVDHSPFRVTAISVFSRPTAMNDPNPPEIQEVYIAGLEPELEQQLRRLAKERRLIPNRMIVTKGRRIGQAYFITPQQIPELTQLGVPTHTPLAARAEWGEHDTLCYLLSWGGEVFGRVTMASPVHGRIPEPDELEPLEVLINLATLALQRTRHLQQVQSYRERLQEINEFLQELNEAQDFERLLHRILERAIAMLPNANAGSVLLYDEEHKTYRFWIAIGRDIELLREIEYREDELLKVLKRDRPTLLTRSMQMDSPVTRRIRERLKMPPPGSTIALPIRDPETDRIISFFIVNNLEEEGVFTEEDAQKVWQLIPEITTALMRALDRERLKEMALHDALTGAYNRHYFTEFIQQEQKRAKRYDYPIALVMADIDDFYEVNDRFGHAEGDRVLRDIAQILMSEVRAHDLVVRYGGDEFLVVMSQTSQDEAEEVMRRLRRKLKSWDCGLAGLKLSISFGVACWRPNGKEGLERVLERADEFMYLRRLRSRARRARKLKIAAAGRGQIRGQKGR